MLVLKPNNAVKWTKAAISSLNLSGKRVTVVGGTDGLGRAIAKAAASRGADVTVVGRTFRDVGTERLEFFKSDLSLMTEAAKVGTSLSGEQNVIVLTTGILAAPKRQTTAENIEKDLAVSYLSRLVILKHLVPRLNPALQPRIFIMGFPGSGQKAQVDDLNSEKTYSVMTAHENTVAGNEALVLHGASAWRDRGVHTYGLNPGLIKTGIRSNLLGTGVLSQAIETLIGVFNITPEKYADGIVPLLFAPELSAHNGIMFNQSGDAVLPSEVMNDAYVGKVIAASEAIAARVPGSGF